MTELGHDPSTAGLLAYYAGLIDALMVDNGDGAPGGPVIESDILMRSNEDRLRLAREVLDWARQGRTMTIWAIIPIKPLNRAKSRLSSVLSLPEREQLTLQMLRYNLETVSAIDALSGVLVISRDLRALQAAQSVPGVTTLQEDGIPQLNGALRQARAAIMSWGADAILVLPADIPLLAADDLRAMLALGREAGTVVIAADRHGQGTNAILLHPPDAIDFSFGVGSFARHQSAAQMAGLTVQVHASERLALDIDTPEDMQLWRGKIGHTISGTIERTRRHSWQIESPYICRMPTRSQRALNTLSMPNKKASRPSGRRKAVWCGMPSCPWPAFAAHTSTIKIGSGVVNNWTRNVALTAATFLTLDDLAQDRIILGIGAWWDPLAKNVGIERRKPLLAMREHVTVVRDLLAMKNVTFHGEFVNVDGIELDVVHGRREPRNVPIMIGATGPKMMKLTGEIADGVVLNYLVSPKYNEGAMEQLEAGGQTGGSQHRRDRPSAVGGLLGGSRPSAGTGRRAQAGHAIPGSAATHYEGQRRQSGFAGRDSSGVDLARHRRGNRTRDGAGS